MTRCLLNLRYQLFVLLYSFQKAKAKERHTYRDMLAIADSENRHRVRLSVDCESIVHFGPGLENYVDS